MQVTLSGHTGRTTSTSDVPRKDGSGYFQISDTSLAVKVSEDTTDWYQLKFIGDSLVKAANYLTNTPDRFTELESHTGAGYRS